MRFQRVYGYASPFFVTSMLTMSDHDAAAGGPAVQAWKTARYLIESFADGLAAATIREPGAEDFARGLVAEMRAAPLSANLPLPVGVPPAEDLRVAFSQGGPAIDETVFAAVRELLPLCSWFRSEQFYPEPEHRHFAEKIWGTLLVGEQDALFTAEDRYIALLMVIESGVTYPLHAHRIEELYYVIAGDADWSHDGRGWSRLAPGATFFNRSYETHTIRANDHPMIAVGFYLPPFGWEGGLVA